MQRTPKIAGELASQLSVVGRAQAGEAGAGASVIADSIQDSPSASCVHGGGAWHGTVARRWP